MKKFRLLQLITGFHSIHHIQYSNGYKIPFLEYGYFKKFGFKNLNDGNNKYGRFPTLQKAYHDCTKTKRY